MGREPYTTTKQCAQLSYDHHKRPVKTAGRDRPDDTAAMALQTSRLVRWRNNERKDDVSMSVAHTHTAALSPGSMFEAVLMSGVSYGTSLKSNWTTRTNA